MNALTKIKNAVRKNKSLLCVGLDSDSAKLPKALLGEPDALRKFNREIVQATADLVCSYKINIAFYEASGWKGLQDLEHTLADIPADIPVILDAKRGDIGNTSSMYARSLFEHFKADATTLSPYMGLDSLEPFLEYRDNFSFILCLTSNKGAADFQRMPASNPLYVTVADAVSSWNETYGNCGIVVGATHPNELKAIRLKHPHLWFLVPGVGTQKGDLDAVVRFGCMANTEGLIINASRSIIYASSGNDFAESARSEADALRCSIEKIRGSL